MKIDPINNTYYTSTTMVQDLKAEETNSTLDEYDETRFAVKQNLAKPIENPIEQKKGTIEDLISLQKSTEKMAQSYGFANVAEAQAATTTTASSEASSSVSAVSSASSGGINA